MKVGGWQGVAHPGWFLLPVISGVLLALSFPPYSLFFLAWVAVVPWFYFLLTQSIRRVMVGGFLFSSVFHSILLRWLMVYQLPAYLAGLFIIDGGYAVLHFSWLKILVGREPKRLVAFAPLTWTFYEFFKAMGVRGFPWSNLAHSQWNFLPIIQISSITGIYGVVALLVFVNGGIIFLAFLLAKLLQKEVRAGGREWAIASLPFALFLVVFSFGAVRLKVSTFTGSPVRVAVGQSQFITTGRWSEQQKKTVLNEYHSLLQQAEKQKADLLIFPESFAEDYDYPGSSLDTMVRQWMKGKKMALAYGALGVDDLYSEQPKIYAGFFLLNPDGRKEREEKRRLVPFGEFVPLRKWVTRWLPQYPWGSQDITPGNSYHLLSFTPSGCRGGVEGCGPFPVGALVCFETLFPGEAREFARRGAQLLISGTNSSWFQDSPATVQMISFEVFRPVETGLYFARAGTGGISTIIDPAGRFLTRLPQFTTAVEAKPVFLRPSTTFYARHGDVLPWLFGAIAFAFVAPVGRREESFGKNPSP